jgi:hypothetical protein
MHKTLLQGQMRCNPEKQLRDQIPKVLKIDSNNHINGTSRSSGTEQNHRSSFLFNVSGFLETKRACGLAPLISE